MQRYQLGPRMNPLIIYMDSVEVTLHFKLKSCFQWRFQYKSFFYQFLLCLHLSLSPSRAEFLLYAATRLLCKRYTPSPVLQCPFVKSPIHDNPFLTLKILVLKLLGKK